MPAAMISAKEALRKVLETVPSLGVERVPLSVGGGRVLAEDLFARVDSPPFDNSSMDGYALLSKDTAAASEDAPAVLKVSGVSEAGTGRPPAAGPGRAVRILTGAPFPEGADAVVAQENAEVSGGELRVFSPVRTGENVRRAGQYLRSGSVFLRRGTRLAPLDIALLASQGIGELSAALRPRVALLSTGSELLPASEPLQPGRIWDSNGPCLSAAAKKTRAQTVDYGILPDDLAALKETLTHALGRSDAVLVVGGVSVGDRDYTRQALERLGMTTVFWRVAIKPGKPLLFGMCGSTAVFGLPGNPLSAWLCFEEFVRPALERMQGMEPADPWVLSGRAENAFEGDGERQQYLFCRAGRAGGEGCGYGLEILEPQASAAVATAARANALALLPAGVREVAPGHELRFRWIS